MTEECIDYDLRHWVPMPDRYIERLAEAQGMRQTMRALIRLALLLLALVAEKRRRRKSVRQLAAHVPGASRRFAHEEQRYATQLWQAWEARAKKRKAAGTDSGQPPEPEPTTADSDLYTDDDAVDGLIPPTPDLTSDPLHSGTDSGRFRDRPAQVVPSFFPGGGTKSGRSRRARSTEHKQFNSTSPGGSPSPDQPASRDDPAERSEAVGRLVEDTLPEVERLLPQGLSRPLSAAGLDTLADIAAFSRTGLAAMVPDIARRASLDAIEGALRRAGLSWSPSSYTGQGSGPGSGQGDEAGSGLGSGPGAGVPPDTPPCPLVTATSTSSTATAFDAWTAAFQRAWSAAWSAQGRTSPPALFTSRIRPRFAALVERLEGVVEPEEAEGLLTMAWSSYLSAHATGQPWPARSHKPAFPADSTRPTWGHGLWAIEQLTEVDITNLADAMQPDPPPDPGDEPDIWSTWGREPEPYVLGPPTYNNIEVLDTIHNMEPSS